MAVAGLVLSLVALAISVSAAVVAFIYLNRLRRVYLTQLAMVLARIDEIEEDVRRLGEGGYVIMRILMEKGQVDEDEMERAWKLYVEEPRKQAREHAELLKEWREREEKDGVDGTVLVEDLPKHRH